MKIGFANIYSYRPHVEHGYYLAKILSDAGHETFFLTCDSSLSSCYIRELRKNSKKIECPKCIFGSYRTYATKNITSLSTSKVKDSLLTVPKELSLSSACTLNRTESEIEWEDEEVRALQNKLMDPIFLVVSSTLQWIKDENLDGVVCFNGRMDMTRAVTYACEIAGIPFITHERTWFGDGLLLTPNANCLSLTALDKLVNQFDNQPLTFEQSAYAAQLIASRFLGGNHLEWRVYNKGAESLIWPIKSNKEKVLIIPSSKNEFAGHDEWKTEWQDNTKAIDDYLEVFDISVEQIVVRFHPNWAENIGAINGERSRDLYKKWCKKRNIHFIDSDEKASTYSLIEQSDIVILNGGSSSVEAGFVGKKVICLGHSTYQKAGFVRCYESKEEMITRKLEKDLTIDDIIRHTLRFVYLRAKRHPQFVDFVKAKTTTDYQYYKGASADRIIELFKSGELKADDSIIADSLSEEDKVINVIKNKNWHEISNLYQEPESSNECYAVERKIMFKWVDGVRKLFPRGDR